MGIFGFYTACYWAKDPKPKYIAIKSMCDYGNEDKDDKYHPYATFISAKLLELLVKNYFMFE